MAEFKTIKGQTIQNRTSDPLVAGVAGATWTSGNNLNTSRQGASTTGTQTASIVGGGQTTTPVANTETYDGTSWTEVGDINTARQYGVNIGTTTSAIFGSGQIPPGQTGVVESWDGSSWTEIADVPVRDIAAGFGTATAGLIAGGRSSPPANQVATVQSWNGSAWSEVVDKNVNVGSSMAGDSPAGAGFVFGGSSPGSPQYSGSAEQFTSPVTSTVTFTAS